MLDVLLQSWFLLTGVCLALLALVIGAQWTMATARRIGTGFRARVAQRASAALPRVISVADQLPAAPPRLYSVAGK